MNKQRKVLITITYNEMGIIIDTKAEEAAQPNLQPTCNQLATDTISRQAAIDALDVLCQEHRYKIPGKRETYSPYNEAWQDALDRAEGAIGNLPSTQPEVLACGEGELSAQTERKTGRWIPVDSFSAYGGDEETWMVHGNPIAFHYCSNCKEQTYADEYGEEILSRFCPNCGAKMEVEHETD